MNGAGQKKETIALVLLAAGGSTRMGEQKLLKRLCGKSVVRRAAETALASLAGPVVAVIGCDRERVSAELADLPVTQVFNPRWQEGQGISAACGVSALAACDAVILMVADQPFLKPEHLNRLIAEWEEAKKAGPCPIVASALGETRGNPALFDAALLPELRQMTGDRGARQLFSLYPVRTVEQEEERFFFDLDTGAAFAEAEEEFLLRGEAKSCFPLLRSQEGSGPKDGF